MDAVRDGGLGVEAVDAVKLVIKLVSALLKHKFSEAVCIGLLVNPIL